MLVYDASVCWTYRSFVCACVCVFARMFTHHSCVRTIYYVCTHRYDRKAIERLIDSNYALGHCKSYAEKAQLAAEMSITLATTTATNDSATATAAAAAAATRAGDAAGGPTAVVSDGSATSSSSSSSSSSRAGRSARTGTMTKNSRKKVDDDEKSSSLRRSLRGQRRRRRQQQFFGELSLSAMVLNVWTYIQDVGVLLLGDDYAGYFGIAIDPAADSDEYADNGEEADGNLNFNDEEEGHLNFNEDVEGIDYATIDPYGDGIIVVDTDHNIVLNRTASSIGDDGAFYDTTRRALVGGNSALAQKAMQAKFSMKKPPPRPSPPRPQERKRPSSPPEGEDKSSGPSEESKESSNGPESPSPKTPSSPLEACLARYHGQVVDKIEVIMPKLAPFVRYGNHAHGRYMKEDVNKALCTVPVASQIKSLHFELSPGCAAAGKCSIPEY